MMMIILKIIYNDIESVIKRDKTNFTIVIKL